MRRFFRNSLILLFPCLFLAGVLYVQSRVASEPASSVAAIPVSTTDWGLSFQTEGAAPIGNATVEDLAKYDAYYLGDTSKKVIYLTFDCGYENG